MTKLLREVVSVAVNEKVTYIYDSEEEGLIHEKEMVSMGWECLDSDTIPINGIETEMNIFYRTTETEMKNKRYL